MNAIGQPLSRADGRLKVTGGARYTGDLPIAGVTYGAIVHSTIANGTTASIDTSAAEKAPGVLAVFTHHNMPRMNPTPKPWSHLRPHGQGYLPLQDDKIHYAGQPVALVVAATLDQAMHAGTLVAIEYEVEPPAVFGTLPLPVRSRTMWSLLMADCRWRDITSTSPMPSCWRGMGFPHSWLRRITTRFQRPRDQKLSSASLQFLPKSVLIRISDWFV